MVTGISRGCHFPNCWRNTTIQQIVSKKCGRRERVGKTSHRSRHLLNVGRMMKGEGLGTRCMLRLNTQHLDSKLELGACILRLNTQQENRRSPESAHVCPLYGFYLFSTYFRICFDQFLLGKYCCVFCLLLYEFCQSNSPIYGVFQNRNA